MSFFTKKIANSLRKSLTRSRSSRSSSRRQEEDDEKRISETPAAPPFLVWRGLTVHLPDQKPKWPCEKRSPPALVLDHVNGCLRSGRLMAVMGSSGAGKTTFLNAISGRLASNAKMRGRMFVKGVAIDDMKDVRCFDGFVPQTDLLNPYLRVREYLTLTLRLRMGGTLSKEETEERVSYLISELALTKCENNIIGIAGETSGISGGERKRLSFAAELCHDPKVIFCDEPTSALDGYAAAKAVTFLRKICDRGIPVMCTIHQPSSYVFNMFDDLYLLCQGRLAYAGGLAAAEGHFERIGFPCPERYNPADHYISILSIKPSIREGSSRDPLKAAGEVPARICDAFTDSPAGQALAKDVEAPEARSSLDVEVFAKDVKKNRARWSLQCSELLKRSHLQKCRDYPEFPLHIAERLAMSLILGLAMTQQASHPSASERGRNLIGTLFLGVGDCMVSGIFVVLNTYPQFLGRVIADHQSGLHDLFPYFFAQWIVVLAYVALDTLLFMLVYYFLAQLSRAPIDFLLTLGLTFHVTFAFSALGLIFSCACNTRMIAVPLTVLAYLPMVWAAGAFGNMSALKSHVSWLRWYSMHRYGIESLLLIQSKSMDPAERRALFATVGFNDPSTIRNVLILGGLHLLLFSVSFSILCLRSRRVVG